MAAKRRKCSACGKQIQATSKFCSHCGCRQAAMTGSQAKDAKTLLATSREFIEDANAAHEACKAFIERFSEHPAEPQMRLMRVLIRSHTCVKLAMEDRLVEVDPAVAYSVNDDYAELVTSDGTDLLANDIVTRGRLPDPKKRSELLMCLEILQILQADFLGKLFDEAVVERDSLLIDGKTRAQLERKTVEDAYQEAEIYYDAFRRNDLERALKGFRRLKSLSPFDTYFRNLNGAALSMLGRTRDALREFLFGWHLAPEEPMLTANLMRELTTLGLHSAAYEVWQHYERCKDEDGSNERDVKKIEKLGEMARFYMTALACAEAGIRPDDYSPDAPDVVATLNLSERPWLTPPVEDDDQKTPESLFRGKSLFISYRRADRGKYAELLHRRLKLDVPELEVFLDLDGLTEGKQFTSQIREFISGADVVILMIGTSWTSKQGMQRLNQTNDLVRREVAWALREGVSIFPVLIENTSMPSAEEFPRELRELPALHAGRLRDDHFDSDFFRLKQALVRILQQRALRRRALNEYMEQINKADTDEGFEELDRLYKDNRDKMPKYLADKSKDGEGVRHSQVNLYGVWECAARGMGKSYTLRLVIESRHGSQFSGSLIPDGTGDITPHMLEGEWAVVIDSDADLLLGIYLNALVDSQDRIQQIVPFHEKVGDHLVGTYEGVQFISKNVEPRDGGF